MTCRLTYVVSHPIQYQAPLLRRIAAEPGIDLKVLFERIDENHTYYDEGFSRDISWNVPLTDGYAFARVDDCNLKKEITESDVIWLHGWQSKEMRVVLRDAMKYRVPTLMRGENCDLAMPDGRGLRGWAKRRFLFGIFLHCTGFLTIGSLNRDYYLNRGVEENRLFPMPYAVDNDAFAAAARESRSHQSELRKKFGIAETDKVVLFAGKLIPRKRGDLLAAAMAHIESSEPAKLLFVGDGETKSYLEQNAPEAIFAGFVNQQELPAYYALADVFVLPSVKEPWGLAVNEAMACGTAVIVSDQVGCGPDLVDDSVGRVFPADDVNALAQAISDVLADADAMGERAQAKIATWSFNEDIEGLRRALTEMGLLA